MARNKAYREAEKKIEAARRSGVTELDLSQTWGSPDDEKLAELPESLAQLTQLQSLSLDNNQLTTLPESLAQLTQLQSLRLNNNQLTTLPESLAQLTQLQSLNLSYNRLTTLPEWLGQLTQLQSLSLDNNQLTTLPESLAQLTQLQWLDLSNNNLSRVTNCFPHSITRLRLGNNRLKELPQALRNLDSLEELIVFSNNLLELPNWIGELRSLQLLILTDNHLRSLPESLADLQHLTEIHLGHRGYNGNPIKELPICLRRLRQLQTLEVVNCHLSLLPEWLGDLRAVETLDLSNNHLNDLPSTLIELEHLKHLDLSGNPLNPELAAANEEGIEAVKRYLRAKAGAQVVLNEAKLILVGEGEVGKSCLLDALRGDPWKEHESTHGIRIESVNVTDPENGTQITLNGWDFGGQRVYRPTHQLFFSSPAVYLVVWKPREGSQQGLVREWIKLVKHREPEAKILVVATHGGPGQRQPDIDKQEIWDLFGKDTVLEFFHVESKPDSKGERRSIEALKDAIAQVAAGLPEMGRSVPQRWQEARDQLKRTEAAYLPLEDVLQICADHKMAEDEARLFISISHRLGHLIHYEHDPALQNIVVLKPDWLATAISFVLDDEETRANHGLVSFQRLRQLWDNPKQKAEFRYDSCLHPLFLRLMERFDLSYKVVLPSDVTDEFSFWQRIGNAFSRSSKPVAEAGNLRYTSLVAQLVPDVRPEDDLNREWPVTLVPGDEQQVQICRILDAKGQSATAEGLFYQLIVRLHKFSLGREDFNKSVHWQRGLVLDDDYNGRALLEHVGNDVRITVRAAYPEAFLSVLTHEVTWLVENFWEGLRCPVMVPCLVPNTDGEACPGLFEVRQLIENKRRNRPEQPCPICNEWQDINCLLRNAPAAPSAPATEWSAEFAAMRAEVSKVRELMMVQHGQSIGRFNTLDAATQRILSQGDATFTRLMQTLTDEAKEGPRLFSFVPVDPGFFDRPDWVNQKFRLTLWCEHSRLPLPELNRGDAKSKNKGVYEVSIPRDWFVKAAPVLSVISSTLSLVLPVISPATKLMLDENTFKGIENQLDLGQKSVESVLKGGEQTQTWLGRNDAPDLERGEAIRARGAVLRQLQAWIKEKDPGFGGLVRVQNKRQEFLWVHPQFANQY